MGKLLRRIHYLLNRRRLEQEIETLDPAGLGVGLVVFAAIAVVAAMWPARRALGIDPSSALRHE